MANKALAALIGAVLNLIFRGFMAHHTQIPARRYKGDGGLLVLGGCLVAVLATHPHGRVDKLALFLFWMAGQTCFRLDILLFNEGMLDGLLSKNRT